MAFTRKNDDAVSPVIGVILMVAVTVILAAVIAAFVFGMAGNMSKGKIVGLTATKDSAGVITITNIGGQDVASLEDMTATLDGATAAITSGTTAETEIGGTGTITGTPATGERVIVLGTFADGTKQILLDTTV